MVTHLPSNSWRRRGIYILVTLIALWLLSFLWFLAQVPTPKDIPVSKAQADAIVVLTGGSGRLEHGLTRLAEGRGKILFISGVGENASFEELAANLGIDVDRDMLEASGKRIVLGHRATDTISNAEETAQWVAQENIRSIRLVTSSYHMPRSLIEFHHLMPQLDILPDPVFSTNVKMQGWVAAPGSARLLLSEYHKYMFRLIYFKVQTLVDGEFRLIAKNAYQQENTP